MGIFNAIIWSIEGKSFGRRWWSSLKINFRIESIEARAQIGIASYEIIRGAKGLFLKNWWTIKSLSKDTSEK